MYALPHSWPPLYTGWTYPRGYTALALLRVPPRPHPPPPRLSLPLCPASVVEAQNVLTQGVLARCDTREQFKARYAKVRWREGGGEGGGGYLLLAVGAMPGLAFARPSTVPPASGDCHVDGGPLSL